MKLHPVHLVAPEPPAPPNPRGFSRRTLFAAVFASVTVGAGAGAFVARRGPSRLPESAPPPMSDGLAWALRVQTEPPEDFVLQWQPFVIVCAEHGDAPLLSGLERLALAAIDDDPAVQSDRSALASYLAADFANLEFARPLRHLVPALHRVR